MTLIQTGRRDLVLPRVGTPRNPDLPTRGGEVAEVARRLGFEMMPWQRHVVDVANEYDPDDEDRLVYDEVDGTVMRQCGKTVGLLFPTMVHRCVMVPHRRGRQRVTFTMQKRDNARRKLERDFAEILRGTDQFVEVRNPKARPGRSTKQWKMGLNNGSEHLLFGQGNYLQIDTPSKHAGHGDTLDVGVEDEIRFYVDDRVEQAMRPAMSTRRDAQLWAWSTAGDEDSFYLWSKVLAGRRAIERNLSSRVCFFEWSIPVDADLHDPEVWWEYHPALGWTIEIDFILSELEKAERNPDPSAIDTFRQEYANQWVRTPILELGERDPIIPAWANRTAPAATPFVGPLTLAVEAAENGRSSAIAACAHTPSGELIVKVVAHEAGTFWVERRLAEMCQVHNPAEVAYVAGGATLAIAPDIMRGAGARKVKKLTGTEYAAGCQAFVLNFNESRARHIDQESLNVALDSADKKLFGRTGWIWAELSELGDTTPIKAATAAMRALETLEPEEAPAIPGYYGS